MSSIFKVLKYTILIIIILVIGIPVGLGFVQKYVVGNTEPPKIYDAPWIIKTTSRIYYGEEFSLIDGTPALKNYWTLDGKTYHLHKGIKQFPEKYYGIFGKDVILVQRITGTQ